MDSCEGVVDLGVVGVLGEICSCVFDESVDGASVGATNFAVAMVQKAKRAIATNDFWTLIFFACKSGTDCTEYRPFLVGTLLF